MQGIIRDFKARMRRDGTKKRARVEKAYMKSPYKFYGVTKPYLGRLAKEFHAEFPDADVDVVVAESDGLWNSDYHEQKMLAVEILHTYASRLEPKHLDTIERWVEECTGWAHHDEIATHLVGALLINYPELYERVRGWSRSDVMWMRRASLVSHIIPFRAGKGKKRMLTSTCRRLIDEKEFFIRKAIGWTLREASKKEPKMVFDFLMSVKDRASGLTLREGSKRLPESQRKRILAKSN